MQLHQYRYIGSPELQQRLKRENHCIQVRNKSDLVSWTTSFLASGRTRGRVTATFIIDITEQLWVADRHSEHVACADSQDVLAAGEITFDRSESQIFVAEITNQSTGYCPEPDCWNVVARVLDRLRIQRPEFFTKAFTFRRCDKCGNTNLIKDDIYECAVCDSLLSKDWNFDVSK